MRISSLFLVIILLVKPALSQNDSLPNNKLYQLNYKFEIPLTLGLFTANYIGFDLIRDKTPLNSNDISILNKDNILIFDKNAVEQNYSQSSIDKAAKASDLGMNISIFLPVLLFLDKEIRKNSLDILLLYLETQSINTSLYTYAGALPTNRIRPFVYYPEISLERKLGSGTFDSFFSGHTSSTATASFFMAKVYIDYHPELKWKKWLIYSAALLPPVFVGYHRYKALKHFPTDILVGITVGAGTGILIPHLHRVNLNKKLNVTIIPLYGDIIGASLLLKM